jgi:hypothetical protein
MMGGMNQDDASSFILDMEFRLSLNLEKGKLFSPLSIIPRALYSRHVLAVLDHGLVAASDGMPLAQLTHRSPSDR